MSSLLVKVRRKMSIAAHRRVRNALEGEYASVFKGRSMDFDDLRLYVPSDDVKDIDWRATARSGQVLIKRYVAIREHNIMLVVDTGRSMAATAPSGDCKRDIAVFAAGVLASIALKHGDRVGLTAGDADHVKYMPLKDSRPHAERMLQYIDTHAQLDAAKSSLVALLDHVRRTIKRRMMLVVISDNLQFAETEEKLLRRLGAQHELLFIAVDDLDPSDNNWKNTDVYDVDNAARLPKFIRLQPSIDIAYKASFKQQEAKASHLLDRLRISNVRIASEDMVIAQIIRLLERQKHARS